MDKKIFLEIKDGNFEPNRMECDSSSYARRGAARGIIKHGNNIALLHVTKLKYHKLPGGGIETGESPEQAFNREILEEVGCECEIESSLGKIVEYRDLFKLIQTSHIYVAHVVGELGSTNFMEDEAAEGFELIWVTPDVAKKLISEDNPSDYEAKFIKKRDLHILEHYFSK